jgi:hypothetical protein
MHRHIPCALADSARYDRTNRTNWCLRTIWTHGTARPNGSDGRREHGDGTAGTLWPHGTARANGSDGRCEHGDRTHRTARTNGSDGSREHGDRTHRCHRPNGCREHGDRSTRPDGSDGTAGCNGTDGRREHSDRPHRTARTHGSDGRCEHSDGAHRRHRPHRCRRPEFGVGSVPSDDGEHANCSDRDRNGVLDRVRYAIYDPPFFWILDRARLRCGSEDRNIRLAQ